MKTTIASQIETARKIIEALRQINPDLDIRGVTQDVIGKNMERYYTITNLLDGLDTQGITLMNERNLILDFLNAGEVEIEVLVEEKPGQ